MKSVRLHVESFVTGPLANNVYLLHDEVSAEAVIIDPSIQCDAAFLRMRHLREAGIKLKAIWNTHGHFDHIYDNARWKTIFGPPVIAHRDDLFWFERLREQALWMGLQPPAPTQPDEWFEAGQRISVGGATADVIHTPGHSPGSVSFHFAEEGICISGDVLFRGSVGRTDLPGCSVQQLGHSLQKLLTLPGETRILPGHGEATTISAERAENPFCRDIDALLKESS